MDILITGGNGFLGRHLISALQQRGDVVRVLVLPGEDTSWLEEHHVKVSRGDILKPDTLIGPMRAVDGVFHLAAMVGAWDALENYSAVNVVGTGNVCRAALNASVTRVIHISSAMVYDMSARRPVTEDDLMAPLDEPYSLTKAWGDMLVQRMIREEQLPAVIIRPGTLTGPSDRLNFGRMADRIRAGRGLIIGRGDNAIPLFAIADMVQGLLLALDSEQAVGKIYNIGTDQPVTQARYLALIAQAIGAAAPRLHVPYTALFSAAYMAERLAAVSKDRIRPFLTRHGVKLYGANNLMSIDKARRELGYLPQVSVPDAVRMACDWYLHPDSSAATVAVRRTLTAATS